MEGLILRPDFALSTQCFVDADFAGAWDKEDCTDPSSVYSHTGYVIMYTRCPILWVSRLQTEVELSTMEAEYIALSQAMRDLIPFMNLVNDVSQILNIKYNSPKVQYKSTQPTSNVTADLYEDNSGALELAKVPKMRP